MILSLLSVSKRYSLGVPQSFFILSLTVFCFFRTIGPDDDADGHKQKVLGPELKGIRGVAMGVAKISVSHLGVHLDAHPVEAVVELSVPAV